jgi:hypothetical protein
MLPVESVSLRVIEVPEARLTFQVTGLDWTLSPIVVRAAAPVCPPGMTALMGKHVFTAENLGDAFDDERRERGWNTKDGANEIAVA